LICPCDRDASFDVCRPHYLRVVIAVWCNLGWIKSPYSLGGPYFGLRVPLLPGRIETLQQHPAKEVTLQYPAPYCTKTSQSPACRSTLAVSHERSCAYLHPVISVCASRTRTMSPASSRRAAAAAPSARRRIRPLLRTGSAESGWDRKSEDLKFSSAWDSSSYISGSTTAWESENDEPIAELMEDIFHALGRLECRDIGGKSSSRSPVLVWQHRFVWSLLDVLVAFTPHAKLHVQPGFLCV
jgi:hypothetical protein